jgi:hypothetical protein
LDSVNWLTGLPKHELFAGGGVPPDWMSLAPPFRHQESTMLCTAFAGCNVASMLQKKEAGNSVVFSPLDLFTRSGGTLQGNTLQNVATAMKAGLAEEADCPWIGPMSEWNPLILDLLMAYSRAESASHPPRREFAIRGLTNVLPERDAMNQALADSPLLAIVQVGQGYFKVPTPAVTSGSLHAVAVLKVTSDGHVLALDSLADKAGFDGLRWFAPDYSFLYAFGVLDLPDDWEKQQQAATILGYPHARARYGKSRDMVAESSARQALSYARQRNPTHVAYIDALWDVYVNVLAYNSFSCQDILNDISSIRRGHGPIFDWDKLR